jgi:hypothetical protein
MKRTVGTIIVLLLLTTALMHGSEIQTFTDFWNEEADFDSLNVRLVGNWPFGNCNVIEVCKERNLAFFSSGGGVYILQLFSQEEPRLLSDRIRTRSSITGLFYDNQLQRLYVAAKTAGLEIWDISDEFSPVKLGAFTALESVFDVYVSDSFAYVSGMDTCFHAGIFVIDISDPVNPVEIGHLETDCAFIKVIDDYLYTASGRFFYIIDKCLSV